MSQLQIKHNEITYLANFIDYITVSFLQFQYRNNPDAKGVGI